MLEDVLGDVLEEMLWEGGMSEVKVRGLAFVVSVAAANEDAVSVVVKLGVFDVCVCEIDGLDLLLFFVLFEIFVEVVELFFVVVRGLKSVGSLGDAFVRATLDEIADLVFCMCVMIVGVRIVVICVMSDEVFV